MIDKLPIKLITRCCSGLNPRPTVSQKMPANNPFHGYLGLLGSRVQSHSLTHATRRNFSASAPDSEEDSDDEDPDSNPLPYIFMNRDKEVVQRREETEDKELENWQMFLGFKDEQKHDLHKVFGEMYVDLLHSIAKNDSKKIGELCEKRLYREFQSGIEWL